MTVEEKTQLFQTEYRELVDYAYGYTYARIPQQQDAEDIVSQVCIELLGRIDKLTPEENSFRKVITGMLRFRIIDFWRAHQLSVSLEDVTTIPSTEDGTDSLDASLVLDHWFHALPPETQSLIYLRYVDDLTYEEVARITDKSPAAIRKWFSRLHAQLEQSLQHTQTV